MAPDTQVALSQLETRANKTRVTSAQKAIVEAFRNIGAISAAKTIEDLLNGHQERVDDGLQDAAYIRQVLGNK